MGINVILTPEDLKKTDPIPPGWYPAEITKYDEAVTKGSDTKESDGSMNAIFFFTILDGPAKGKELRRYLNEKSLYFGKNLWATLGFPKDEKGNYKLSSELFEQTVGSKMMVYIKKGSNGYDSIEDWKKMS